MSTSPRPDDRTETAENTVPLHEEVAGHVGAEFAATRRTCRATILKNPAVHHLAHYSSGVFDFGVDVLGDPPRPANALPGATRREELQRLGRQLSFVFTSLDRTLQEVRTGGLIRVVLHTENGAVICNSVVPREHVIGLVLDRSAVDRPEQPLTDAAEVKAADQAVGELATELRAAVRLPSANPGGWESAESVEALITTEPAGDPRVTVLSEAGEGPGRLVEACRSAVRPGDLQLVGYCTGGEVAFLVDQLEDQSLAPFFTQIAVAARRRFYQGFAGELGTLASKLNRTVSSALGGLLMRVVLDVEQGAIYYYRLGPGEYLVGATIDQSRVSQADARMARLAREVG